MFDEDKKDNSIEIDIQDEAEEKVRNENLDENEGTREAVTADEEESVADVSGVQGNLQEKYLRLQAEFLNYKKRTENEQKSFADSIRADFVQRLLPVIDDFDRMIEHIDADENREHVIEGIKLIHRKLNDVLEEQGLEQIQSVGEKFDPNVHEAVMVENHDHLDDDHVIEEWRKGYKFRDRLLRPAQVKVNKKDE
ncbi:MAG: nucleotide exchange factor GrpE [Calditrichaeota bacterium]|nr:nucleotide exchange factor GrpE [Calditrichota bacterium]